MVTYIFRGASHIAKVRISGNKKNRTLEINTEQTNNKFIPLNERLFKDRNKRHQLRMLLLKMPSLTTKQLRTYVLLEFASMGYQLIKEENGCTSK